MIRNRYPNGHSQSSGSLVFYLHDLAPGSAIELNAIKDFGTGTVANLEDALLFLQRKTPGGVNELALSSPMGNPLSPSNAFFDVTFNGPGSVYDVTLFWGPADGGQHPGSWAHAVSFGRLTDQATTQMQHTVSGLTPGTAYFFTWHASNDLQSVWTDQPRTFTTPLGPPVAGTGAGATPGIASAILEAELQNGPAEFFVYWGTSDGQTNRSAWDHSIPLGFVFNGSHPVSVTNLLFGQPYFYRTYASNSFYGSDWADASEAFSPTFPGHPISHLAAPVTAPTSADLQATLDASHAIYTAWVYWGTNDGGASTGAWENSARVGTYSNLTTNLTYRIAGLTNLTWFYTWRVENALVDIVHQPSATFAMRTVPVIDTGSGATPGFNRVTLNGALTAGNYADVTIYWGAVDGGTDPALWANQSSLGEVGHGPLSVTVSDLLGGVDYVYRIFASNTVGTAWSAASVPFKSPAQIFGSQPTALPGLVLWLDASDMSTLWQDTNATLSATSNGAEVARWDDKSGNLYHMLDLSMNRPTLALGVQNLGAASALYFDNDHLGRPNDLGIAGNLDRTVVTVWANAFDTGDRFQHAVHFGSGGPSPSTTYGHIAWNDSDRIGNHYWFDSFSTIAAGSTNPTIAMSSWDGDAGPGPNGQDLWWVDGIPVGTNTRTALATGTDQFRVGSRIDGPLEGVQGHLAEVIIYDRVLAEAERTALGQYLSSKYSLLNPWTSHRIVNGSTSNIFPTVQDVTGTLDGRGGAFDVLLYYGQTNGGMNASAWESVVPLGLFTDTEVSLGTTLSGLLPGSTYHFTFRATNCLTDIWADPVGSFMTPPATPVVVNNGLGAVPGIRSATLHADLAQGELAEVVFFWGAEDGRTNRAAWEHVVSLGLRPNGTYSTSLPDLLSGVCYHYRVYASNSLGEVWSTNSVPFITWLNDPGSSSNLVLWLDAADPATRWQDLGGTVPAVQQGDAVLRWDDKSGHNRDVLDLSGATPTLATAVPELNAAAALSFEADQLGRVNDLGITGNVDRTVISVWANAMDNGMNYEHTIHVG
ncbi:MAG: hypothetical protein AAF492_04060, partial [Verrucomicrobiota bacterium]